MHRHHQLPIKFEQNRQAAEEEMVDGGEGSAVVLAGFLRAVGQTGDVLDCGL